jgi:hypothetical protein
MKIHEEEVTIYGRLLTPFGEFSLLALEPEKNNLPWYLRDGAYSFYIKDDDGYAKHIHIKGEFAIIPYSGTDKELVSFEIVEEENIKVDSLE